MLEESKEHIEPEEAKNCVDSKSKTDTLWVESRATNHRNNRPDDLEKHFETLENAKMVASSTVEVHVYNVAE